MEPICYELLPSAYGPIGIVWREVDGGAKVRQILLSDGSGRAEDRLVELYPGCLFASHPAIDRLVARMRRFLDEGAVAFDLAIADMDCCTAFRRRVLLAEYAIPCGSVSTYGRIAAQIGAPRAARAVGNALARNPFPLLIPCHRAIRADGTLGGYQGGLAMKRALLEMEGVRVSTRGRVIAPRMHY
ncbi:MAG: methylated-DNA--[protein]-cysteine S-methyltransferase [Anaerolineae bacterium]|nr:methylated-DNA--[protein]-cysteine S-methyltransferase [Anaerolineae bacterium]